MMEPGRLPVAPRPYRDELLSSWMARVACRYGLTAPELVGYFSGLPSPLPIDDGAPAVGQTRVWAQICGVDPDRLHRLSLSRRYPRRPRSWYVSRGPEWASSATSGSIPVCLACFAGDHDAGRDAYLRAGWMLAERCICPVCQIASNNDPHFASNRDPFWGEGFAIEEVVRRDDQDGTWGGEVEQRRKGVARPEVHDLKRVFPLVAVVAV